jgi:hypothetical protein
MRSAIFGCFLRSPAGSERLLARDTSGKGTFEGFVSRPNTGLQWIFVSVLAPHGNVWRIERAGRFANEVSPPH